MDRRHTSRTVRNVSPMGQQRASTSAVVAAAAAAAAAAESRDSGTKKSNSSSIRITEDSRNRITDAGQLSLSDHMVVLDEAIELPPFGFNVAGLEQRLKRRLGLEIAQVGPREIRRRHWRATNFILKKYRDPININPPLHPPGSSI